MYWLYCERKNIFVLLLTEKDASMTILFVQNLFLGSFTLNCRGIRH